MLHVWVHHTHTHASSDATITHHLRSHHPSTSATSLLELLSLREVSHRAWIQHSNSTSRGSTTTHDGRIHSHGSGGMHHWRTAAHGRHMATPHTHVSHALVQAINALEAHGAPFRGRLERLLNLFFLLHKSRCRSVGNDGLV